jgi:HPt (histidine-containing phosphotransfer) domain-containing protein
MTDDNQNPHDPIGSKLADEDPRFADVVVHFVNALTQRLAMMEDAIQAGDFEALREAANQLSGAGEGYGYPALTELATKLERQADAHVLDQCIQAFDELRDLCERVVVSTDQSSND